MLVCRNKEYAECAVKEIVDSTGNTAVRFELADLSRYGDIRRLVTRWTGPLHGLINNAACAQRTRQETPEGIEMQFATNVLAYFRLIDQFTDILKTSVPARVVNVASYWAGGLDLNDLEFTRRNYDNDLAYRQSKQANRMLSAAFAERLEPFDVAVNACHPGDVNSTLSNDLGFGGHETPDQGAKTPVWLATDPMGLNKTGRSGDCPNLNARKNWLSSAADIAVFPGGNAYIAEALLKQLSRKLPDNKLLNGCLVFYVQVRSDGILVSYIIMAAAGRTLC